MEGPFLRAGLGVGGGPRLARRPGPQAGVRLDGPQPAAGLLDGFVFGAFEEGERKREREREGGENGEGVQTTRW